MYGAGEETESSAKRMFSGSNPDCTSKHIMIAELATTFCMATAVHLESRGESGLGQRAVAHVILNRSKKQNRPVCDIVWQRGQFAMRIPSKRTMESKSYSNALEVAKMVMTGQSKDPTRGALFFHANYVNPYWKTSFKHTTTIGNHLFYK